MSRLFWYPGHELLVEDIVRAEDCFVWDARGNEYVDLEGGVWCVSIGHGNPRILRAISDQAARIAHAGFNYSCAIVEKAAREVLSILGFNGGRCVLLCSGSEAVEFGVRVARMSIDRPLFLTMADSYFGAYGSASRRDESEWLLFDWFPCAGCERPGTCDSSCERWAAVPWDRIGGFLFEPGSSSGLVRFPPEKLIRSITRAVEKGGGLFLVNEVTTGIGRTGKWFGFQHYGVRPDIVAVGKGIGNGYPVSAAAFAAGVEERLAGREVKYAQSHQNDPLGAAVLVEVVRVIREEGLIERSMEISAELAGGLDKIRERTGRVREIRARGLMIAIEIDDDPDRSLTIRTHRELVRRGFLVGKRPNTNVLRLDPPLTIGRAEIEAFLAAFEDALRTN
ncbi:MAG: aspartate aminotransferase family protein [Candidatus Eisenbacteria bacterium]|nr:aspartate aminotransferase family protein [Candidatus Eisenbacteria bacterium]